MITNLSYSLLFYRLPGTGWLNFFNVWVLLNRFHISLLCCGLFCLLTVTIERGSLCCGYALTVLNLSHRSDRLFFQYLSWALEWLKSSLKRCLNLVINILKPGSFRTENSRGAKETVKTCCQRHARTTVASSSWRVLCTCRTYCRASCFHCRLRPKMPRLSSWKSLGHPQAIMGATVAPNECRHLLYLGQC